MEDIRKYGPQKIVINESCGDTVLQKERYVLKMNESSINTMLKHGENGMVIISSQKSEIDDSNPENSLRPEFEHDMEQFGGMKSIDSDALYDIQKEWLKKRNAKADKELKAYIKSLGYSFTPVFGGYHSKNNIKDTYEPSYIIYNYKIDGTPGDFNTLESFAKDMCGKFKQESVYVKRPGNEPPVYIDKDGNQLNSTSSNNFKINNDDEQFFTTTKRDKSQPHKFTADIQFESMYMKLKPASLVEKRRRMSIGEFILD